MACCFIFNGWNYSFKRLPFGLNVSSAEFQKSMDFVLGLEVQDFITIYVDDIIIVSETLENHCDHLREVFKRFTEHNVIVNLKKS